MNLMGVLLAVALMLLGHLGVAPIEDIQAFVLSFDFSGLLLHGVLGLLLFAGAMLVDIETLGRWARPIAALATVGVAVATLVAGTLLWGLALLMGFDLPFLWCLLFGALISPTDPIGALAVVRKVGAPKPMEIKLVGESLLNDATGVMLFLVILGVIQTGEMSAPLLARELLVAPVGGAALGWGLGWLATRAIARTHHHPTEILITLALAVGAYGLAEAINVSAPCAAVAAGIVIGHRARRHAMTEETRRHLDVFWEGIDEIFNALLFVLIGLELVLIDMNIPLFLLGVVAWFMVLAGRWVSVSSVLAPMHRHGGLGKGTTKVMVWGGLRGGISLALALSLPAGPQASMLVAITFVVVAMSSGVQGMTLAHVIGRQIRADEQDSEMVSQGDGDSEEHSG